MTDAGETHGLDAPLGPHPLILEVNALVLLGRLSAQAGRSLTLGTVPAESWRALCEGFDCLWLMGAWQRSEAARVEALGHPGLHDEYRRALPDWSSEDVVASPYAVAEYRLDPALGAPEELAALRETLRAQGVRLILDFVPNHLARDHRWTREHPEYFVRATPDARAEHPEWFFETPEGIALAHGRDPYFAPWTDTVQLNYGSPEARRALIEQVLAIAEVCDGVRCDMAMLVLNDEFARTWGAVAAGSLPAEEFWAQAIEVARAKRPGFAFIAEAYWDREPDLLRLGFDYAYDKRLYDALRHGDAHAVRGHIDGERLRASAVRFIENHDEERAVTAFGRERSLAAAAVAATLPGAFLVHDGQREARRARLPVQLGREPSEQPDGETAAWYARLLNAARRAPIGAGEWRLASVEDGRVLAWWWRDGATRCLVAVNYSPEALECRVPLDTPAAGGSDRLSGDNVAVDDGGVTLVLGPWQARIVDVVAAG